MPILRHIVLALVVSGCAEPEPEPDRTPGSPTGCIEVSVDTVDLGGVDLTAADATASASIMVRNACQGDLRLRTPRLQGQDPGVFFVEGPERISLGPGQQTRLSLRFAPDTVRTFAATLVVPSSDPERPEREVQLMGRGEGARLQISPSAVDHGSPHIGCSQDGKRTLTNTGTAPLVIDQIELLTASPSFRLDLDPLSNGPLPFTLEPGASADIYLPYTPFDEEPDSAVLVVSSSEPGRPRAEATASGTGSRVRRVRDAFEVPEPRRADLLFLIDRSPSMTARNAQLADTIGVLFEALRSTGVDVHVAAVAGDEGCIVGPEPYIDASFSTRNAELAFRRMMDTAFERAPQGLNDRAGFSLAAAALSSDHIGEGGCNAAFYRDGASLSTIAVSDAPEQSPLSWTYYVSLLRDLKTDPASVRMHAIAGQSPPACPDVISGGGHYEVSVATGGQFESICAADWSGSLRDIATASLPPEHPGFVPSSEPVLQTLEVRVDGLELERGWSYDAGNNTLTFEPGSAPTPGSTVEIHYDAFPDCEG